MQKINGQDMRRHNVHLIIDTVLRFGPISRTELRDRVGLTAATVINITNELLEWNILVQEGLASGGSKGRKALMLNVNPGAFYTLGASVTTRSICIGLADFRGQIVDRKNVQINNTILPEEAVEIIASEAEVLLKKHDVSRNRLMGLGVAAPGPLDVQTELITVPPDLPNWRYVPLRKMLRKRLNMPVCVSNESNAAAMAEYRSEDYKGGVFFIGLFHLGVGGGFVHNGQSLMGFHGSAGEIGHLTVVENGRKCGCGGYGCLEAMISEEALLEEAHAQNAGDISLQTLFDRSRDMDPVCYSIVYKAAMYLAKAMCSVVHMVSPSRIVLGGPLTEMSPQLVDIAFRKVHSQSYPHDYRDIRLEISAFGEEVFLRGAISTMNVEASAVLMDRLEGKEL